jgi:hypothetical protein
MENLFIEIPSLDLTESGRGKKSSREKDPVVSDSSGWFSMVYAKWDPEDIAYDLMRRVKLLQDDYVRALREYNFDECVLAGAEEIEDIILNEFDRIEFNLSIRTHRRLYELLDGLQSTKVKYMETKDGIVR